MKFRVLFAVLLLSILTVGTAFAQEAAADKELKITGETWMGLGVNLTKDHGNSSSYFMDRAQVNFDKKSSDMVKVNFKINAVPVSNVNDYVTAEEGERIYIGNVGFGMQVKQSQINITPLDGATKLYLTGGIIELPMGAFMEELKGDYQFNKSQEFYNMSGIEDADGNPVMIKDEEFVNAYTDEKEYDAGIGVFFKYEKLVEAHFTASHGDGYKNLGGENLPDSKYCYSGRLTASPIEQLKITLNMKMNNKKPQKEFWDATVAENTPAAEDITDAQVDMVWTKALTPGDANYNAVLDGTLKAYALGVGALASNPGTTVATPYDTAVYNTFTAEQKIGILRSLETSTTYGASFLAAENSAKAGYLAAVKAQLQDTYDSYNVKDANYGGSIAWKDESVSVGLGGFYLTEKIANKKSDKDGDIVIDFWANTNLKAFIGMPITLWAGYSYYKDMKNVDSDQKKVNLYDEYVAVGYAFDGEASLNLMYKQTGTSESSIDPEKVVRFVATAKF